MQSIIHFTDISINLERLKEEYFSLKDYDWHQHFSKYDSGWKAIPLISFEGKIDSESNKEPPLELSQLASKFKKTVFLKKCPYMNEIIDSFKCHKLRTRLMKMEPGTVIPEHSDTQGWFRGIARLHIPIITHDEVYFFVNGKRAKMNEGEIWYTDVTKPHSVRNESNVTRVHLVIDLLINRFVRDMFPKESLTDGFENFYLRRRSSRGAVQHGPAPERR